MLWLTEFSRRLAYRYHDWWIEAHIQAELELARESWLFLELGSVDEAARLSRKMTEEHGRALYHMAKQARYLTDPGD